MPCHPAWAGELTHREQAMGNTPLCRRQIRRSRRKRKTSYRQPRCRNRTRPQGWRAPSLLSRMDNVFTWAKRPFNFAPVSGMVVETVRFDTQLMQHPEISGVEYQQGELAGYEVREYLCERLIGILARAKAPLKDGAAINSIRYATGGRLKEFGLQLSFWSGKRTKYSRTNQSYGKSHWLDAVCGGETGGSVHIPPGLQPRNVSAAGRGSPRMCR
jgi:hypothetical protein